jgi:excisionase family DNA binding protein
MSKSTSAKHAKIEDSPVLPFDNSLSGSSLLVELLTVAEAAAFLTISKSGIRRLQQARQLPFIKVGGSVRFAKRDLLTYLAKRMIATLDP